MDVLTHAICYPKLSLVIHSTHYDDVIMGEMVSQFTSLTIVYSTVYSGADQSKHQSSASLAFVWGIHRGPVNSPHKWPVPVTRKMFPFDDVIMHDAAWPGARPWIDRALFQTYQYIVWVLLIYYGDNIPAHHILFILINNNNCMIIITEGYFPSTQARYTLYNNILRDFVSQFG